MSIFYNPLLIFKFQPLFFHKFQQLIHDFMRIELKYLDKFPKNKCQWEADCKDIRKTLFIFTLTDD